MLKYRLFGLSLFSITNTGKLIKIHVKSNHTFKRLYEYLNKKLRYRDLIYFILKLFAFKETQFAPLRGEGA